jgi:hypothetical protein
VVTGLIDLYTGGERGKAPDEEANLPKGPGSVNPRQGVEDEEEEEQTDERAGGSATL